MRIDAADVLHVMLPLAPGQARGLSWLAPIVVAHSEFDQLTDALQVGIKVAAMHAGFLTDMNGNAAGSPFDGDQSGSILTSGLEPGTLKVLPSGFDIKFNTPQQAQQTAEFLKFQIRMLAAGLGPPSHLLDGDLTGANYSSLRAGLIPFRQRIEQVQYTVLVPQLLNPIFRRVVAAEVLSGNLDPAEDLFRVDWIMPRPMQVDPLKDTEAVREMLALGLMSRRQAVAELGWSIEELDAEIAADREREAALGLTFTNPANAASHVEEENPT